MMRLIVAKIVPIPLAKISGISAMIIPYTSQRIIPTSIMIIIGSERSFVCLVLIARKPCGSKANVVKNAATNPSMVIKV